MLGLGGLDRTTDSLKCGLFFFLISQSGTEENSCGFILVLLCNVLGSIGFRDFFIVAPALYKVMEPKKKKNLGKKSDVAEVKPLTSFPTFSFLFSLPRIQW